MKKLASLLLIAIVFAGCAAKKGYNETALQKMSSRISFEYESFSRGSYKKVIVKQDTVVTVKDREMANVVTTGLDKKAWNDLLEALEKVNTETMKDLKSPTEKRFYDGAMIATLKVIKNDTTYESSAFDHGYPPAEIKDVVQKIMAASALESNEKQ